MYAAMLKVWGVIPLIRYVVGASALKKSLIIASGLAP